MCRNASVSDFRNCGRKTIIRIEREFCCEYFNLQMKVEHAESTSGEGIVHETEANLIGITRLISKRLIITIRCISFKSHFGTNNNRV